MGNRTFGMRAGTLSIMVVAIALSLLGLTACSSSVAVPVVTSTPAPTATSLPATSTPAPPSPTPVPTIAPTIPASEEMGLSLDPPAEDGSVSGTYRYAHLEDHVPVRFWVTADGVAGFHLDGNSESDNLIVFPTDDGGAKMLWNGVAMDGFGPLTDEERAALQDYFENESHLLSGLSFIPLDIACRGEDVVSERQVAALLFPLQMHFKYLIGDRVGLADYLAERSACNSYSYGPGRGEEALDSSLIQMTSSAPVPMVNGHFPFDGKGAVAPPAKTAEQPEEELPEPASMGPASGNLNQFGACNAMCRGACGPDCEPNNCKLSSELRCEKDAAGKNTGMLIRIEIYDCGMHQGCIDHDDCYDYCNVKYGCDTFEAAFCRHGRWQGMTQAIDTEYCDQRAIEEWGHYNTVRWARGYGPQPMREIFEYTDRHFGKRPSSERCPVDAPVAEKPAPVATAGEGPRWVMDGEPVINAAGALEEYYGGGETPGFFGEARFKGTWHIYTLSETSITMEDRWVDHEYESYNVTIRSTFDAPPAALKPGDFWYGMVRFSHSGTLAEGNPGARFHYSTDKAHSNANLTPDALAYFPWSDSYFGEDRREWTIKIPPARAGDTFQITASWWNCPVCNVTWTYKVE